MKNLFKDIWFYVKDFLIKTPTYVAFILMIALTAMSMIITKEIVYLGLYCYECVEDPILTKEMVENERLYLAILIVSILVSIILILITFSLKKLLGRLGINEKNEEKLF